MDGLASLRTIVKDYCSSSKLRKYPLSIRTRSLSGWQCSSYAGRSWWLSSSVTTFAGLVQPLQLKRQLIKSSRIIRRQ